MVKIHFVSLFDIMTGLLSRCAVEISQKSVVALALSLLI